MSGTYTSPHQTTGGKGDSGGADFGAVRDRLAYSRTAQALLSHACLVVAGLFVFLYALAFPSFIFAPFRVFQVTFANMFLTLRGVSSVFWICFSFCAIGYLHAFDYRIQPRVFLTRWTRVKEMVGIYSITALLGYLCLGVTLMINLLSLTDGQHSQVLRRCAADTVQMCLSLEYSFLLLCGGVICVAHFVRDRIIGEGWFAFHPFTMQSNVIMLRDKIPQCAKKSVSDVLHSLFVSAILFAAFGPYQVQLVSRSYGVTEGLLSNYPEMVTSSSVVGLSLACLKTPLNVGLLTTALVWMFFVKQMLLLLHHFIELYYNEEPQLPGDPLVVRNAMSAIVGGQCDFLTKRNAFAELTHRAKHSVTFRQFIFGTAVGANRSQYADLWPNIMAASLQQVDSFAMQLKREMDTMMRPRAQHDASVNTFATQLKREMDTMMRPRAQQHDASIHSVHKPTAPSLNQWLDPQQTSQQQQQFPVQTRHPKSHYTWSDCYYIAKSLVKRWFFVPVVSFVSSVLSRLVVSSGVMGSNGDTKPIDVVFGDAEVVIFAVNGLCEIVRYSFADDKLGYVQRKLNTVLDALLGLYQTLELCNRLRPPFATTVPTLDEANRTSFTRQMQSRVFDEVKQSIYRLSEPIRTNRNNNVDAIQLSKDRRDLFLRFIDHTE